MEKQLPLTAKCLENIENAFEKTWETNDSLTEKEKSYCINPMLHLAEAIYLDTKSYIVDNDKSWAATLAKYLLIMTGISNEDIKLIIQ